MLLVGLDGLVDYLFDQLSYLQVLHFNNILELTEVVFQHLILLLLDHSFLHLALQQPTHSFEFTLGLLELQLQLGILLG